MEEMLEINRRLFDHSSVLKGEVNYFIKQHELSREWREDTRLKASVSHANELSQTLLPSICNQKGVSEAISSKVSAAITNCEWATNKPEGASSDVFLPGRERRCQELDQFEASICEQVQMTDVEYDLLEKQLRDQYDEMAAALKPKVK